MHNIEEWGKTEPLNKSHKSRILVALQSYCKRSQVINRQFNAQNNNNRNLKRKRKANTFEPAFPKKSIHDTSSIKVHTPVQKRKLTDNLKYVEILQVTPIRLNLSPESTKFKTSKRFQTEVPKDKILKTDSRIFPASVLNRVDSKNTRHTEPTVSRICEKRPRTAAFCTYRLRTLELNYHNIQDDNIRGWEGQQTQDF